MQHGNLFVISGPSGVGKGTLVARLVEMVPDCWVSVSATTRQPRPGDVDGVNYLFVSEEQFDQMVDQGAFLEWAGYTNNRYGTPRRPVIEHMAKGEHVILEIDVQGALQVAKSGLMPNLVFIEPPSLEELEQRLRGRGTDDDDAIRRRLEAAEWELEFKDRFDKVIVNDTIDRAAEELASYVTMQFDC